MAYKLEFGWIGFFIFLAFGLCLITCAVVRVIRMRRAKRPVTKEEEEGVKRRFEMACLWTVVGAISVFVAFVGKF